MDMFRSSHPIQIVQLQCLMCFSLFRHNSSYSFYEFHNSKLGKLRIRNAFTAEHNFTQRPKFQQRYYYTLKVTYRNNKLPLKMRPYITNKLYYYSGGNPRIYDIEEGLVPPGSIDAEEGLAPNGFHAYRIQAGVRMEIAKNVSLNVF